MHTVARQTPNPIAFHTVPAAPGYPIALYRSGAPPVFFSKTRGCPWLRYMNFHTVPAHPQKPIAFYTVPAQPLKPTVWLILIRQYFSYCVSTKKVSLPPMVLTEPCLGTPGPRARDPAPSPRSQQQQRGAQGGTAAEGTAAEGTAQAQAHLMAGLSTEGASRQSICTHREQFQSVSAQTRLAVLQCCSRLHPFCGRPLECC